MENSESYYENEVIKLQSEIEAAEAMTEAEIAQAFNAEDKEEYLSLLREELEYTLSLLQDDGCSGSENIDCGFADESDFLRYKFG